MRKIILFTAWSLIIIGGFISLYFVYSTKQDGFSFCGANKIDFATTGQFGDFMGGAVGTVFALAGTLLIILSFNEQTKQNKREAFESTFFEMVRLHRENVSEMSYTKFGVSKMEKSENRKVFRVIFQEFLDCYREVRKFSNSKNIEDYLLPKHKEKLSEIIRNNGSHINILEFAQIDIAYNIVFFGVGEEGEIILRDRFKRKYNHAYFYGLLRYIKLKPKKENEKRWIIWQELLSLGYNDFKRVNQEFYNYRKHLSITSLSEDAQKLVYEKEFEKYYGGHQHRLGHYFRHLFQSYKYLSFHPDLTEKDKYLYAKTLRAQLSTYEQALLFINSISSLGMKWEYTPDVKLDSSKEQIEKSKLITRFNLIKNLPGHHLFGLRYKTYYPKVKYEAEE